jgi:hypothetical protein
MREERMQILQMIQEGVITAEEGAKLLAALSNAAGRGTNPPPTPETPVAPPRRWLRIRVTDKETGRVRVNLTIPVGLLDWGLKMAEMGGANLSLVREAIHHGAEGKVLEVDESESNERVEIFVE